VDEIHPSGYWLDSLTALAKVAKVLGSIPAESERPADEAVIDKKRTIKSRSK
jgi:hypothetical protein